MVNAAEGNKRMSTDSGMVGDGGTVAADLSSDSIEATMERELIERNGIPTHVGEQFADALQDQDHRQDSLVAADTSTDTLSSEVKYQQLQNELEIFKKQLVDTEASFHRRKAILERELMDNEDACQSKIDQFQTKFMRLADEARMSDTNYKNEIFMLEESITQLESAWRARMDHLERKLGQHTGILSKESDRLLQILDQKINLQQEAAAKEIEILGDHFELNLGQQNEVHSKDIERIADRTSQIEHIVTQRLDREKEIREKALSEMVNKVRDHGCDIKSLDEEHKSAIQHLERAFDRQSEAHKNEIDSLIRLLRQQEDIVRSSHDEHEILKQSAAKDTALLKTQLGHLEQTMLQNHERNQKGIERVANQASQKEEAFKGVAMLSNKWLKRRR